MPDQIDERLLRRLDESDDELFYQSPRLVVHIDDYAISAIGEIFAERLPVGGLFLDVMSSWRSHIPPSLAPSGVVGLGLNRVEMQENPALTEIVVHNVNREPRLPFDTARFDGAML